MLSLIVAKASNNGIGKNNQLMWHISEDMKRFKEITTNHTIIMGRKTFESLGRVLPNRKHVVLTTNKNFKVEDSNVEVVNSIYDIKKYIESDEECIVIGGAKIYELLLPYVKKMYITEINKSFDADTFFPKIDEKQWRKVECISKKDYDNPLEYEFCTYERA